MGIKELFDKRNNKWSIVTLDRLSSKAEIFIFSDLYNKINHLIHDNKLIFVVGKLSNRQAEDDNILKIIADDVIDMKDVRHKFSRHINVKIPYDKDNKELLESIKSLVSSNLGTCRFIINIESSTGYMQRMVSKDLNVSSDLEFILAMRKIVGNNNVWIDS